MIIVYTVIGAAIIFLLAGKMDEKEKYSNHSDSEVETDILDEWE